MRRASHTRNHTRKTASSGKQKFIPPVADTTWECIVDTADVLCVYRHCCDTMKESVKSCHKLELLQKNLLWVWLNFISVQYFKWNHKLFQKMDKQSSFTKKKLKIAHFWVKLGWKSYFMKRLDITYQTFLICTLNLFWKEKTMYHTSFWKTSLNPPVKKLWYILCNFTNLLWDVWLITNHLE